MPVKSTIIDKSHHMAEVDNADGEKQALVVATRELKANDNRVRIFTNETYGADLNQDIGISGTPEGVHDGTDKTQWTASAVAVS